MAREKKKKRSCKSAARKKANKQRGGMFDIISVPDGFEMFKVDKAGNKRLDIMPYEVTEEHPEVEAGDIYYERTFFCHDVPDGNGNSTRVICPSRTINKPCPVCERRKKLSKDPSSDYDEIKQYNAKERQLFNLRDLQDPEKRYIWDVSFHLFGKLLDERIKNSDEDDDFDVFADPEGGKTLKVLFSEKKFGKNSFYEATAIDFKERDDYGDDVMEESANLDKLFIIKSYEELESILEGSDSPEEKPSTDTPKPKYSDLDEGSKSKKGKKKIKK